MSTNRTAASCATLRMQFWLSQDLALVAVGVPTLILFPSKSSNATSLIPISSSSLTSTLSSATNASTLATRRYNAVPKSASPVCSEKKRCILPFETCTKAGRSGEKRCSQSFLKPSLAYHSTEAAADLTRSMGMIASALMDDGDVESVLDMSGVVLPRSARRRLCFW